MSKTLQSLLLISVSTVLCLDNGVGRKPAMGWNSWNKFGCDINETVIRNAAEQIVALNLSAKGYEYINIDDCWNLENRTDDGH